MKNKKSKWSSILITTLSTLSVSSAWANHVDCNRVDDKKESMNVLFIAIDDYKPIAGCYGNQIIKTPSIDQLANQGTLFTHAYCQQAISGPSRASLMTGWTPDHTRVWDLKTLIRDENLGVITMPQTFKKAGYCTAAVGKIYDPRTVDKGHDTLSWSVPYIDNIPFLNKDFDKPICAAYQSKEIAEKYKKAQKEGIQKGFKNRKLANYIVDQVKVSTECEEVPNDAYLDGATAKATIQFIEQYKSDKPFFLAVGFKKPHLPFVAPKKYWDLYDRADMPLAKYRKRVVGAPTYVYHKSSELKHYVDIPSVYSYNDVENTVLPDSKSRELIHGYYACISYVDALIGEVIASLEAKGLRENTIIVLWGDHGWHLGDHGLWNKHTNFENATRVPMIISVPNSPTQVVTDPVQLMDIYPTLLDLCKVKRLQDLDGHVLTKVLQNKKVNSPKPYAVSQYHRVNKMGYSIRTKDYRYTLWTGWKKRKHDWDKIWDVELYDYNKDPLEKRNLANDPTYKKVVKQMQAYWMEYKKEILKK